MPNRVSAPWIVIPVRTHKHLESGLARKNLRSLAGKSLLTRAIETGKQALSLWGDTPQILVLVEDTETAELASRQGVQVLQLANIPDSNEQAVLSATSQIEALGATATTSVIVLDPALPLLTAGRLIEANRALQTDFESVSLHFEEQPVIGFVAAKLEGYAKATPATRIPHLVIHVAEAESVYISSLTDWAVAEFFASRKRILIRTDVSEVLDHAHAARTTALADELASHHVTLVITSEQTLNEQYFRDSGYELATISDDLELLALARKENADLVVLDHHLNSAELVSLLSGFCKVVTVEDYSEAAEQANIALNAMFESTHLDVDHQLSGADVQLLPTDFQASKLPPRFSPVVKEIVILFSGQDMNGLTALTLRALDSIEFDGQVTVVRGLGSDLIDASIYDLKLKVLSNVKHYAAVLKSADLAVASSDLMLAMLCAAGVPTLTLAQNTQELLNTQAKFAQGVIALGFGSLLSTETLAANLDRLIEDAELRLAMHDKAVSSIGLRSNAKVVKTLLHRIGF